MKKTILALLSVALVFQTNAQSLKTPSASTTQTVKQEFGLGNIELSYSRPNTKGRNIFGGLVPYGSIWRTGANYATTLTFSEDVIIGGKPVTAGKYGLLTIPGAAEWTVIISKQIDVTSPAAYKQDMDVVRVNVPAVTLPFSIESFMILFERVQANSLDLMIVWDNTSVSLPITQEIDAKVMSQIDDLMTKDNRPYFNAAVYYIENNKNLDKASEWLDQAIVQNSSAFWIWYQKAKCLSMLGKKAEAKVASVKSMELARTAKNNDYVTLNEKLQASLK